MKEEIQIHQIKKKSQVSLQIKFFLIIFPFFMIELLLQTLTLVYFLKDVVFFRETSGSLRFLITSNPVPANYDLVSMIIMHACDICSKLGFYQVHKFTRCLKVKIFRGMFAFKRSRIAIFFKTVSKVRRSFPIAKLFIMSERRLR